jgi:hypothetical protein
MRWWARGFLTLLVAASAPAQGQDVLSDTELFASYCLGYFNRALENGSRYAAIY